MSRGRITASLRDRIVRNILDEKFAAEREQIKALDEQQSAAQETMNRHAWEAAFSEKDRRLIESLPAGWTQPAT